MQFDFKTDKEFICDVVWSKKERYSGKFIYHCGKELSLIIYSTKSLNGQQFTKEQIFLNSFDELGRKYCITLKNCRGFLEIITGREYRIYTVYFDYALISRWKFFDFEKHKIDGVDLYFSTWNEFFVQQNMKDAIALKSDYTSFKLRNKLTISYKSSFEKYYIDKQDDIFNKLFDTEQLNEKDKNEISKQINELIKPYADKLNIRNINSHEWYINIALNNTKHNPDDFIWVLHILIAMLTHDFSTSLVKANAKATIDGKEINFNYLDYRYFPTLNPKYNNKIDVFNYDSFSEKEWKTILNNLFKYSKKLFRLYSALTENNMDCKVEEFMLARYIASVETISGELKKKNPKDTNGKFDRTILNFIEHLDKETQTKVYKIFQKTLKPFCANKNKRKWQAIGVKISNLRATLLHFADKKTNKIFINMLDYYQMYKIFELIIIDYIFEVLEVSESKRLKYKKRYLHRLGI